MANVNRCIMIGRVVADPEVKTFQTGTKIAKIRFCVNNRKKNQQSGQWEDVPCWIDLEAWQSGQSTVVNRIAEHWRKGMAVYIEGRLELGQWEDNEGNKRQKHKITVTDWQFVERKEEGQAPATQQQRPQQQRPQQQQPAQQRPQQPPPRRPATPNAEEPVKTPWDHDGSDTGPGYTDEDLPF